jgi:hypothetical protein
VHREREVERGARADSRILGWVAADLECHARVVMRRCQQLGDLFIFLG